MFATGARGQRSENPAELHKPQQTNVRRPSWWESGEWRGPGTCTRDLESFFFFWAARYLVESPWSATRWLQDWRFRKHPGPWKKNGTSEKIGFPPASWILLPGKHININKYATHWGRTSVFPHGPCPTPMQPRANLARANNCYVAPPQLQPPTNSENSSLFFGISNWTKFDSSKKKTFKQLATKTA